MQVDSFLNEDEDKICSSVPNPTLSTNENINTSDNNSPSNKQRNKTYNINHDMKPVKSVNPQKNIVKGKVIGGTKLFMPDFMAEKFVDSLLKFK